MPPLRVRILEHHDIEIAGVSAVLARFPDRIDLITDPHVAVEVTLTASVRVSVPTTSDSTTSPGRQPPGW